MKITQTDYEALQQAIVGVLTKHPNVKAEYRAKGYSDTRLRWDLLWASKFDITPLYGYLHDSHIDTALRAIINEMNVKE